MNIPDLPLLGVVTHALGWTLVHFLWQGLILAAVYQGMFWVFRRGQAALRYWAGLACLTLALVVPVVTFTIYYQAGLADDAALALASSAHVAIGAQPSVWLGIAAAIEPALPWIVALWFVGVAVLSLRTAVGWVGTRRLITRGVEELGAPWKARTAVLAERFGIRRAVRVLRSTRVRVPTLIGWLRPVILLPAGVLTRLPSEQIEMIIAHELGHVRRHDYLFNLLQLVVETLLFYHPAIRWLSRRIREDRELCCDDLVVRHVGRPILYARALANLETVRARRSVPLLAASGGDLLSRVHRIVASDLPRHSAGFAHVGALVVLVFAAAAGTQPVDGLREAMERPSESIGDELSEARYAAPTPVAAGRVAHRALHRATPPDPEPAEAQAVPVVVEARPRPNTPAETITEVRATAAEPPPIPDPALLIDAEPMLAGYDIEPMEDEGPVTVEEAREALNLASIIRPVETAAPRYPFRARARGVEGFVKLQFSVDDDGSVRDVQVVDSFPEEVFDRAATKALKKWRFEGVDELAQSLRLVQTFDFTLIGVERERMASRQCLRTGRRTCSSNFHNVDVVYVNPPTAVGRLDD